MRLRLIQLDADRKPLGEPVFLDIHPDADTFDWAFFDGDTELPLPNDYLADRAADGLLRPTG